MNGMKIYQSKQTDERLGKIAYNNENCLMKIVQYTSATDIVVEFQDDHKAKVHTRWDHFKDGSVKNPYYKSVYGVGCIGDKVDRFQTKREYQVWHDILRRCYDTKYHQSRPTYTQCEVCNEWLIYENFYNWLTSQENYNQWIENTSFHVDKDILFKHNKIYAPETCCLVPENVNTLFIKSDKNRGIYPIGVSEYYKDSGLYQARCNNQLSGQTVTIGIFDSPAQAFNEYKSYKEHLIKSIAQIEYEKHSITKKCYEAMMNYEVEITD